MKIIIGLILLVLKGSSGQDLEARFDAFINQTLSGLGDWLKENNFAPSPIPGIERFYFNGTDTYKNLRCELIGEIQNRFYHGAEQNISPYWISSNLTDLTFQMHFTYGSGSSDYVTGEYSINGKIRRDSIRGSGNFTRSNPIPTPLYVKIDQQLGVSPDGYFIPGRGQSTYNVPRFTKFLLEGMDWLGWESEIKSVINSWYEMQMYDETYMHSHTYRYMDEIFAATPIVDIIGVPLPPTMTSAEAENFKKEKIVQKSEPFYDEKAQQMLQKQFISFSSNENKIEPCNFMATDN